MLGRHIHDPLGLEGAPGSTPGLGLLDCETTLAAEKQLRNVSGHLALPGRPAMTGYEIHMGVTQARRWPVPPSTSTTAAPKAPSRPTARSSPPTATASSTTPPPSAPCWPGPACEASAPVDFPARREADLDRLADAVEAALDWGRLAGVLPGV